MSNLLGKTTSRIHLVWRMTVGLMASAVITTAAWAHHSGAMFDQTKKITMDATVAKFEWGNPHVFVVVDGTNDKGEPVRYSLECSSPNLMGHAGWKFNTLKAGERVTVEYFPLRNGDSGGMLSTVKLPDGKVLNAW